jgi:GNAT superfamily N-acetyltransferase
MGERAAYICAEAGVADLPELARLRTDWTVAQGGGPDEGFVDELRRWWDSDGAHRHAWLARYDGSAVGMANAAVFERMPRPGRRAGRWAYVANVWVDPGHRRRGVATLLMEQVVAWCRDERMDRIVLNPSEMSVPLYEALGFRPADDLLRLDL